MIESLGPHASHAVAATTTTLNLILPSDFGYVLLAAIVMGIEILLISFIFPGKARQKYFTQEFMDKHFGEQHKEAFKTNIAKGGYPDMGSGVYSSKLTYQEWYEFNNAQRAHLNFVEWAPTTLICLLVAGLYFPIPSAALGLGIIIARIIYSAGYLSSGPGGRLIGALSNDLFLLALFVLAVISCIYLIQGDPITFKIQA